MDDPQYKAWRRKVFGRDKGVCRMPKCGSKLCLQAHHIKRWADAPLLRFDVNNGITLCLKCHKKIAGMEHLYEKMFKNLINSKALYDARKLLRDAEKKEREGEV